MNHCPKKTGTPIAVQIWNTYRNRTIGRQLQNEGIIVIPTISWSDESSFSFCFEGIPPHSVVSVSSVGVMRDKVKFSLFEQGYNEMLNRLKPSKILFYGTVPKNERQNPLIKQYNNTTYDWFKKNCSLQNKEI